MVWKRRAIKWCGHGSLGIAVAIVVSVLGFLWLAQEYTRAHPLNLTSRIPQVEKYLLPDGLKLSADNAELFFDNGPVVRVSGLGLSGADGQLGIFVEQAAIKLSSSQLFLLVAAPKTIEAHGVTLRIVREAEGISIAGLNLPKTENNKQGVVEWLNGMGWSRLWGRLRTVRIANLNLLVKDDVQNAEWVLEQGNMVATRYGDEGERGTLTAMVRRLYGDMSQMPDLNDVPVLVSFAHANKADDLEIRGRIDRANAQMVADYFPPQFKNILEAQGQVEIGTRILERNRLDLPWVTMRLTQVKVNPPEGFSKPLEFPKLAFTASYVPPRLDGQTIVSDTDVLILRELQAETTRGATVNVSGTVSSVQNDPLINLSLSSKNGEVQGIFDFFPDELRGFAKALNWLRPNIEKADYINLSAHYVGRPSAFPGCGDNCGLLEIDTAFTNGKVHFLEGISSAEAPAGTFQWRGQTLRVAVPEAMINQQKATNVMVTMSNIFATSPTDLRVTGSLSGQANGVMAELNNINAIRGKVPQGITGKHISQLDILVPMPRNRETTFADSTVLVSSTITDARVEGLNQLRGAQFAAPKALATLSADKTLRVQGSGTLSGYPMKVDWRQNLAPNAPDLTKLSAQGTAGAEWLMSFVSTSLINLTGVLGVNATMQEDENGKWLFNAQAEASRAALTIPSTATTKPVGESMMLEASGSYMPSSTLEIQKLNITGKTISTNGSVHWNPTSFSNSSINLPRLKLGKTDISINTNKGMATISGARLDLSNYDLFGTRKDAEDISVTQPKNELFNNMAVNLNVAEILMNKGRITNAAVQAKATHGVWDIQKITGLVDGKTTVDIRKNTLPNQPGRQKMTIEVSDLGHALDTLGIYDQLAHGKLSGEINYDAPDVGGGLITLQDFEVKNASILMQLLNLLSLEQLLAGTGSTLFKTASIPVRVDGSLWHLDNARLEGPSMDMRLTGTYNRSNSELNIDGKMAPGIPLNRLVGKIPLLGTLLTGSQDGVVVADFKVKGKTSDPQINVRPLSVITPGLLKDFWRGISSSPVKETEKPNVQDGRTPAN